MREIVVNLKKTILTYAADKNHTHDGYVDDEELAAHINTLGNKTTSGHVKVNDTIASNINDPVSGATIFNKLSEYLKKTDIINNLTSTSTDKPLSAKQGKELKSLIDSKFAELQSKIERVTTDWSGHSITNPKDTTTKVNKLVTPGYYKYVGTHATFSCDPDVISYSNALIRVEKQSNHIIQHLYATSYSSASKKYKIDGRIFVRYGYTTESNGETVYHWGEWYVSHIPWRERKDLVTSVHSSAGTFKLYECTAGYVFKWKRGGTNDAWTLPMKKYDYVNVCEFKALPIVSGYVVGNLIGHMDIRIHNNCFKARSINNKGEVISGVDIAYFVPRTN